MLETQNQKFLFESLHTGNDSRVLFRCISGSRAYGTHNDESDTDIRGVFILPQSAYLSLNPDIETVANASNDIVYYSLRRIVELALAGNPNFIELLYTADENVLYTSKIWQRFIDSRDLFMSRKIFDSHVNYAISQIKRSRGQNKWVHNPKPEAPPVFEGYCWIVLRESTQWNWQLPPFRPVSLSESGIDLNECHASKLEHCPGVYRLYHIGPEARGAIRGGRVVCESIPLEREQRDCIGLLMFNEQAYESDVRDHRHYWKWRESRNDARWISQEKGEIDYDAKNLMHAFRLILSAENVFQNGYPLVNFEGENLRFLLDIRAGKFDYETLMIKADEIINRVSKMKDSSSLPESANTDAANSLLLSVTEEWGAYINAK